MLKTVVLIIIMNSLAFSASNKRFRLEVNRFPWRTNHPVPWKYVNGSYNAIPQESLEIVLVNYLSESIRCSDHYFQTEFTTSNELNGVDTIIKVQRVIDEMSTLWRCNMKDIKNKDKDIIIYFNMFIKDAKPPQLIIVNDVVLPTQKVVSDEHIISYSARYNYKEEDEVDVACINTGDNKCTVQLNYDYADKSFRSFPSAINVGFRTILQARHNRSQMICTYRCSRGYPIQAVVKFTTQKLDGSQINNQTIHTEFKPNVKSPKVKYISKSSGTSQMIDISEVGVITIDAKLAARKTLSINLPYRNTAIELYVNKEEMRQRFVYYEYVNGEKLTLKCSKPKMQIYYYLHFYGTESRNRTNNEIIKNISLNSEKNNTMIECSLRHPTTHKILEYIRVLFRAKNLNKPSSIRPVISTTSSTTTTSTKPSTERSTTTSTMASTTPSTTTSTRRSTTTSTATSTTPSTTTKSTTTPTTPSTTTSTTPSITTSTTPSRTTLTKMPTMTSTRPSTQTNISAQNVDEYPDLTLIIVIGIAILIIIVCIAIAIWKTKKLICHKQSGPAQNDYVYLQPDITAIPAYPAQWESDYAVPDGGSPQRDLYTIPLPKNQRKNSEPQATYGNLNTTNNIIRYSLKDQDLDALYAKTNRNTNNFENLYANQEFRNDASNRRNTVSDKDEHRKGAMMPKSQTYQSTYANCGASTDPDYAQL